MTKKLIIDLETLGLAPFRGRIISIAVKNVDTGENQVFAGPTETILLENFWEYVGDSGAVFIGFNSDDFDIPFLIKRSLIRNIKMKPIIRSIDLRKIVNGFWFSYKRDIKGKLSDWAKVLHMAVKTESGSQVYKLYRKNDWYEIIKHNIEDIEITYALYLRCKNSKLIKY